MKLSQKQNQVVESSEKYICVIAGAGSGKTRTLTERIKKLISVNKRGERVLAITFSNRAADELKERLLISFSLNQLNELAYVGTVHNFCMDIVSQRASSIGLPDDLHIFESFEDRFKIFMMAMSGIPYIQKKYTNGNGKLDNEKVRKLFERFVRAKRKLRFPTDYPEHPLAQRLYQDYNDLMLSHNAIDFDDILLYSYKILVEKPSISRIYHRIYKHVCVDEAQDLNKAQYSVIKAIAGDSASLLMVGDPSQSIYGFIGSSPKYMCKWFVRDYKSVTYELNENYRSSKKVIEAARIIEPTFEMEGIIPIIGEVAIHSFDDEYEEATWVANKVQFLIKNGHADIEDFLCTPEQFIVLARNRYVFKALEKKFAEQGVEYNLRTTANRETLSESSLFKVFDLGLRLLMNPMDVLHFEEIKRMLGNGHFSQVDFNSFRLCHEFQSAMGIQEAKLLNRAWDSIHDSPQSFRFDKTLEIFSAFCSPSDNQAEENELALIYNDFLSWRRRWDLYTRNSSLEDRSLSHLMRDIALGKANASNERGVTLSTVHMSKGLEYDIVFIIGLNQGVFPDYRALNDEAQLAEEQHNMFVSITRSKRLCFLTYPKSRQMPWGSIKAQASSQYIKKLIEGGTSPIEYEEAKNGNKENYR